jgi:hypothetical protein
VKVLLDTDLGNDIDDALTLAYLLAQPDCELLGVTTVTAGAVDRARRRPPARAGTPAGTALRCRGASEPVAARRTGP